MAVWCRKPRNPVVHSDQGSQFTSMGWVQLPAAPQSGSLHEPLRQLPQYRRGRELLQSAQAREDQAVGLGHGTKPRQDVFDYIEILQPGPQARPKRNVLAHRVRTATPNLIPEVSTELGAIQIKITKIIQGGAGQTSHC